MGLMVLLVRPTLNWLLTCTCGGIHPGGLSRQHQGMAMFRGKVARRGPQSRCRCIHKLCSFVSAGASSLHTRSFGLNPCGAVKGTQGVGV